MIQLVLELNDNKDFPTILRILEKFGATILEQKKVSSPTKDEQERLLAIINKGVKNPSFGDAALYQRTIRQDRKLPFRK